MASLLRSKYNATQLIDTKNDDPLQSDSPVLVFPGDDAAPINTVGGKGYSLMKMSANNIHVPSGFILTTFFFKNWMKILMDSSEFHSFIDHLNRNRTSSNS